MHERLVFPSSVHLLAVLQSAKRCLAELLQAYLAYPSIQNDMKDAAKECHQHMQSQPKDQRVKIHLVQNVLK